ncbi:MAG: LptF/LptG family permease [Planctomycetaceae bacterium]|nr:MAG: LptF/LptG family permease [Planctomycetaceae bacterium]
MRDGEKDTVMTGDMVILLPDSGASMPTLTKVQPTLVAMELRSNQGVVSRKINQPEAQPMRMGAKYPVGRFVLPATAMQAGENITLDSIEQPNILSVGARNDFLRTINKIKGTIIAEMHSRVAFGVSCFLLVALGSALGLIFRGGQIITAFAIVVAPAMLVFVMILMGKDLVANPDIQRQFDGKGIWLGLAAIWGGIVILAVANVFVYLRLLRR